MKRLRGVHSERLPNYADRNNRAARSRNEFGGAAACGVALRRANGYSISANSSAEPSRTAGSFASNAPINSSNDFGIEGFACEAGKCVDDKIRLQIPCSESDPNGRFPVTIS